MWLVKCLLVLLGAKDMMNKNLCFNFNEFTINWCSQWNKSNGQCKDIEKEPGTYHCSRPARGKHVPRVCPWPRRNRQILGVSPIHKPTWVKSFYYSFKFTSYYQFFKMLHKNRSSHKNNYLIALLCLTHDILPQSRTSTYIITWL